MASSPITSWQIDGETMEIVTDFMATHSNTLAWKILWMEEPVGDSPWGSKESDTTERLHFFTFHLGRQTSSLGKASLNC